MSDTPTKPINVPKELSMPEAPVLSPPAPAVSPTGETVLPPKYVPRAMFICAIPALVAAAFNQASAFPKAQIWLLALSGLLWGMLGAASPGLRKAPPAGRASLGGLLLLAVAIGLLGLLTGCAAFKADVKKAEVVLVDCGKQDSGKLLAAAPAVLQALAQKDYLGAVDDLGMEVGLPLVQCVVAELAAQEQPMMLMPVPAPPSKTMAQQYLAARNVQAVNVKPMVAVVTAH